MTSASAPSKRTRGMREGYTTGACATAAAVGAATGLLTDTVPERVTIHLPAGRDATFDIASYARVSHGLRCSVIKDAGDDPDVTHGAEIRASVWRSTTPGIALVGGVGVGVVTRPGLGLEIGGAAINPVPRRMITDAVRALLEQHGGADGLRVEIAVPEGERLAQRTLNGRLGIIGGISILGTTGIVKPWSTAAWRASVLQAIDVAAANGVRHVVLSTGGRSEAYTRALYPHLPEMAFVEMGEFTGHALKRAVTRHVQRVTVAGMIGKFSKLAQGHMMTHVAGNQVEPPFLAELAREAGAASAVAGRIAVANTARHVQEIVMAAGCTPFFGVIVERVVQQCRATVHGRLLIEAILYDFDGSILARGG